ncbi:hypothetical protein L207DRAFT_633459 [Hyaloscypha variabilis F]|uniref:AB hydrolase-1 domain-containing protein n=1 Tax=Hyaloscypha variabilis (strain UAMH 11265 / GT02V1 / F) TaxID=1149755 RepID=A0A2J6RPJ6_HYAVF|nr:hypothetical protein L207DRAFT_633459 [Hyaloscypha variabilis F]
MVIQGPKILSKGESPIWADIVFVHGLRGDAFDTWTTGSVCWPKDLLAEDLKNARIITWGYDSRVANLTEFSSQNSIFRHATNLLQDIARKRISDEEENRPIVFVGHSLGGIVIKEALVRSSEMQKNGQNPTLGAIYTCTSGVVFLGTPHRGSDKIGLAQVVSSIAKLALRQPNDKVLRNLAEDSDILERQRESFTTISSKMPLVCLHEELPTGIGIIVPQHSACIDGFLVQTGSIPANHSDMCKFETEDDIGYQRTSGFIISLVKATKPKAEPKAEPKPDIQLLNPSISADRETLYQYFLRSLPREPVSRDDSHAMLGYLFSELMEWKNHAQGPWNYWLHDYLKRGQSVNIRDFRGKTPLHHALVTKYEREDKVRALVDASADVTMRDFDEQTPVDLAKKVDEGLFVFLLRTWQRSVAAI